MTEVPFSERYEEYTSIFLNQITDIYIVVSHKHFMEKSIYFWVKKYYYLNKRFVILINKADIKPENKKIHTIMLDALEIYKRMGIMHYFISCKEPSLTPSFIL
jgi:hypothetical protein